MTTQDRANAAPPLDPGKAGTLHPPRLDTIRESVRSSAVFVLLAALLLVFALAQPAFLTVGNLMSILQGVSVVAIIGAGVTVTLAIGGFDLSVGAVAASSVMAASYAMIVLGLDATETVLLVIAFGALVGLFNALLIVRLKVPDLLATLSTMFLLTGLQLIPTAGRSISAGLILPNGATATGRVDPAFLLIGRSSLWGTIPIPVVLMLSLIHIFRAHETGT